MREHLWKPIAIAFVQKVTGSIPSGDTKFCSDGSFLKPLDKMSLSQNRKQ